MKSFGLVFCAEQEADRRACAEFGDGTPKSKQFLSFQEHARLINESLRKSGSAQDCRGTDSHFFQLKERAARDAKVLIHTLLTFERSHIDREAVLHIGLEQSLVSLVDLLDWDDFDISGYVVLPAEIEHLVGFGDAANGRTGKAAAAHDQAECRNGERLLRRADERDVPIAA